jgi:acyl-CoA synthetase (AMP-forming)/AMP-acid ligase II
VCRRGGAIVDLDGHDVGRGVAGEIASRGPDRSDGYVDPAFNEESFSDGWLATGDIGVLDEADYLTITDRKKDIIIRGGENISAAEVEDLLLGIPDLIEVAVAAPDPTYGEKARAVVRAREGAVEPTTLEDLTRHLATTGLAKQKWPERVVVVDDFPRTASGKITKSEIRAWFDDEN